MCSTLKEKKKTVARNGRKLLCNVTSCRNIYLNINSEYFQHGKDIGELRDPLGVACLLNGDIVVTEWGNKRLQIFDIVGKPVSCLGKGTIGPQGVAITLKVSLLHFACTYQ